MTDLEYIQTGLFTRFIPITDAGEEAWRVMHAENGETVLNVHAENVIGQLRRAGYSVKKAKKTAPITALEIDNLLTALGV